MPDQAPRPEPSKVNMGQARAAVVFLLEFTVTCHSGALFGPSFFYGGLIHISSLVPRSVAEQFWHLNRTCCATTLTRLLEMRVWFGDTRPRPVVATREETDQGDNPAKLVSCFSRDGPSRGFDRNMDDGHGFRVGAQLVFFSIAVTLEVGYKCSVSEACKLYSITRPSICTNESPSACNMQANPFGPILRLIHSPCNH